MRYLTNLLAAAASVSALSVAPRPQVDVQADPAQDVLDIGTETFLLELNPGRVIKATEEMKWDLKRNGVNFMDISETRHTYPHAINTQKAIKYPTSPQQNSTVHKLIPELTKSNMKDHLETFTSFHTRYYKSDSGIESATWLFGQVSETIKESGANETAGATVSMFPHPWGQFSIIARIPGKSNKTVVVGAHQDSINLFLPSLFAAPGADDDGSGTVTILEALRVLLKDDTVRNGQATNTIEFHWYSAEEGGLLGSQAIFNAYHGEGKDIVAMLQQDMTGYTHGTIAAGEPESVGVITDFVDPALTDFIKMAVTTYCTVPYVSTKCGYACSDHASASKYGYPSAFVIESDFKYSDKKIHTTDDKIEYLDFDHMLQHARMTLGYALELSHAKL